MTEWTKTPPTEPGWYWYRDFPVLPDTQAGYMNPYGFWECAGLRTEAERLPGEWWPERIQEPPSE